MAALARTHGVDFVPHQTQPTVGHQASLHFVATQLHSHYPCEYDDRSGVQDVVFAAPPHPEAGRFVLTDAPGLGLEIIEEELSPRMRPWKV
jgi:L-alanine-DL-glutamate epimerase-like enolase superfamily enzyme